MHEQIGAAFRRSQLRTLLEHFAAIDDPRAAQGALRAAHTDDQHAIRRQIRDVERDIELATRRIGEIAEDIERLMPTTGDAFAMTVTDQFYAERKLAGRALMKEILTLVQLQQDGEAVIASIGGFDLKFSGERLSKDGFHYATMLLRTGVEHEVELPITTTPIGAIARLEHALADFEGEQENYRRRLAGAQKRLASYRPRVGEAFSFEAELKLKREQLAELETDLASDKDDAGNSNSRPADRNAA